MNQKRSEIWEFFTTTNKNNAKCNFCNIQYSFKGGATANLTRHLKRKHPFSLTGERGKHILKRDADTSSTSKISTSNLVDPVLKDKKRSKIWSFFTATNKYNAKCNLCNLQYSYRGGGTANLSKHLKRKHPLSLTDKRGKYILKRDADTSKTSTSDIDEIVTYDTTPCTSNNIFYNRKRRKIFQTTLSNFQKKPVLSQTSIKLDNQLLKMIVSEYQPFSLVEDREFCKFVQMLNPNYVLPSRKTLSEVILPELYTRVQEIITDLLLSTTHIAIATDGWISISNESYQSITAYLLNKENKLVSVLLGCYYIEDSDTAQNLSDKIKKILSDWQILDKVCAVVTDNTANITAAVHLLGWQHVLCFAHSLNSIMQKALQEINVTQNKVKSIVEYFKRNPRATEELQSLLKQKDSPVLKLKQDVSSRWNSTYDMLDRVLKMKDPLQSALITNSSSTLSNSDFEVISWCCKILKPFKDVTDELSGETAVTISKILLFNKMLKTYITDIKSQLIAVNSSEVHKLCDVLISELNTTFQNIEEHSIYSEATFLDPRFKKYGFSGESTYNKTYQKILQAIITLIIEKNKKNIEPNIPTKKLPKQEGDNIWSDFASLWSNFDQEIVAKNSDYNPNNQATIEIEKYIQESLLPRDQDPLKWWEDRKFIYKHLYFIAKSRLCIPATSVPFEQILSKTGQTLTDRRSKFSPSKVEKILFLNHNLKFLDTLL